MLNIVLVVFIISVCGVSAQIQFSPGTNVPDVCLCATAGQCSIAGGGAPSDGSDSAAFQARILNTGAAVTPTNATTNVTVQPVGTGIPLAAESQDECMAGLDRCCPPTVGYTCGLRYPSVVNAPMPSGAQVNYGDFSFQVVLYTINDIYVGSGALIDQLHVLTAAHKVANLTGTQIKVRIGDWNLFATTEPFPAMTIVGTFNIHPNYTAKNLKNNIAIITLSQVVPLGKYPSISNICLPNTTISGMRCFVSGWGKPDNTTTTQNILSSVDVPLVDSATCQNQLRATALGSRFMLDNSSFICAGGEAGKDACNGDGGAPLSCFIAGRYYLVGMAAWGMGCGVANVSGVYVNVMTYIPWIQGFIIKEASNSGSATTIGAGMTTSTTMAKSSSAATSTTTTTGGPGTTTTTTTKASTTVQTNSPATTIKSAINVTVTTTKIAPTTVKSARNTTKSTTSTRASG